jgi:hypothetical protein
MFTSIIENLESNQVDCPNLKIYLARHIEVDAVINSHLYENMLINVCEGSNKWKEVLEFAIDMIKHRINLWDGILENYILEEEQNYSLE